MLQKIRDTLNPYNAELIAVSKTKPDEAILDLYNQDQRHFGENRVQELVGKYDRLPKDIRWHLIGHLQKNKVKYIASFVHLIHSVDSYALLETINKEATKHNRTINVLLQLKIGEEESKYGLSRQGTDQLLEKVAANKLSNIDIHGVMGMASFTPDKVQVRSEFDELKSIYDEINKKYFSENNSLSEISMGMSGDYEIALEAGSTMVRIGSLLFGSR